MKTMLLLLLVVLLGGLTMIPIPTAAQAGDWCFEWDFTRGTYMWNVTAGAYNSIFGAYQMEVIDEEDGIWGIAASWTHERDVFANRIEIDMHRAYVTVQEKYVAWYVDLFGINELGRVDLAAGENSYTMIVEPDSAGVGGPSINFAIQSDVPSGMLIDRMRVYGWGAAPFEAAPIFDELPLVECEALAITSTPTTTHTPSASPTTTQLPTDTPTPTATPQCDATDTVNFLTSDGGATSHAFDTYWVSGVGWRYNGVSLYQGVYRHRAAINLVHPIDGTVTGIDVDWVRIPNGTRETGDANLEVFSLSGVLYQSEQHDANAFTRTNLSLLGVESFRFSIAIINDGPAIRSITISYRPSACITPTTTPSPTTPPNTATPTATATREPTRTTNPNITPTVTNTSLFFFTPPPSTATPLPSATFIQPTLRPATYTPRPPPTEIPFATLPPPIQATLGTLPPPVTGTVTMTPTGTPTSIGGPGNGGDTIYGPGETERGIGGLFGAIIGVGQNGFTIARRYLEETIAILGEFTGAWQTAPVFPIEGLPQCATNRLASELCAIYYILTYTVLSGALGSVIMPAALVVLDMALLFSFLKLARAILARFAEITKV